MQQVTDAIEKTLGVSQDIAALIVRQNSMTLAFKTIPEVVTVVGYVGDHGHDLMILNAKDEVVCPLRVSVEAVRAVADHRRTAQPGETVPTEGEARMIAVLLDALRAVDPSAMIDYDGRRFLNVDGSFDMGLLARTLARGGVTLPAKG